jgi:hypothetical protein
VQQSKKFLDFSSEFIIKESELLDSPVVDRLPYDDPKGFWNSAEYYLGFESVGPILSAVNQKRLGDRERRAKFCNGRKR